MKKLHTFIAALMTFSLLFSTVSPGNGVVAQEHPQEHPEEEEDHEHPEDHEDHHDDHHDDEHPEDHEHPKEKKEKKKMKKKFLKAVEEYIEETLDDEDESIPVENLDGESVEIEGDLELLKIHRDNAVQYEEDTYFVCSDFRATTDDDETTKYDFDFFKTYDEDDEEWELDRVLLHKVNGEKVITYVDNEPVPADEAKKKKNEKKEKKKEHPKKRKEKEEEENEHPQEHPRN